MPSEKHRALPNYPDRLFFSYLLNFIHPLVLNEILKNGVKNVTASEEELLAGLLDRYGSVESPAKGVAITVFQVDRVVFAEGWVYVAVRTGNSSLAPNGGRIIRRGAELPKSTVRTIFVIIAPCV